MRQVMLTILILILWTNRTFAQSIDLGSWNVLNLKYEYNNKLSFFGEAQIRSLKFYSNFNSDTASNIIFKDLSPSNGFYVSSLAINDEARKTLSAGRMIYNFINGLKTKGIKYIIFDGMQDTLNIFLNPDGTPNEKRLNSYNIKLVLTFPSDEDRLFCLMIL